MKTYGNIVAPTATVVKFVFIPDSTVFIGVGLDADLRFRFAMIGPREQSRNKLYSGVLLHY